MREITKIAVFLVVILLLTSIPTHLAYAQCSSTSTATSCDKSQCERSPTAKCGSSSCCGSSECSTAQSSEGAFDMEALANCEICSRIFQEMDLMMACDYSVNDWSHGVIFSVNLRQPEMMSRFRAFEECEKASCAKYESMCPKEAASKLCPFCNDYFALRRRGLKEERVQTPTGTLTITTALDEGLLRDTRALANNMRQTMASFETAMAAQQSPKSASCSTSSECASACPEITAALPVEVMQSMQNCSLCKMMLEQPDMMQLTNHQVIRLKNGIAINNTVKDNSKVGKYHEFNQRFMNKYSDLKKLSPEAMRGAVCHFCNQFGELESHGATMDWNTTATGSLTVITAGCPDVVRKINALGDHIEAYDKMEM